MSTKIHHGHRIHTADPTAFLALVEQAVTPVRNKLDASLYARLFAELIDRHDIEKRPINGPVLEAAYTAFQETVNEGRPGEIWNDPHSLDIDYGYPPDPFAEGWLYLLINAQHDDYANAIRTIPGVEPFPYWDHVDPPDDATPTEWEARRQAWEWLTIARRISDVTHRWTHRNTSDPSPTAITPAAVLAHLPTKEGRANPIACNQAVAEHFGDITGPELAARISEVWAIITSQRVQELTTQIAPTLRTITTADLT